MLILMQNSLARGGFVAPPHLPEVDEPGLFSPSPAIDPTDYYNAGVGNPAVSTADYYLMNGLYWMRPYDLLQFGATGISIAAANGRYFWIATPDHVTDSWIYTGSIDFMGGYSDDPGVLPKSLYPLFRYNNSASRPGGGTLTLYQLAWLVYNPDDETYPFYIYAEGHGNGISIQHETGLARSADLLTWSMYGPTHINLDFTSWWSFQRVVRRAEGDWYSVGVDLNNPNPPLNFFGQGVSTSTDGLTWVRPTVHVTDTIGDRYFEFGPSDEIDIDGQIWIIVRERDNSVSGGQQYLTMVAVDEDFNVLSSPEPIRLASYGVSDDEYPGPEYLQSVAAYVEDGIAHIYSTRGFFTSAAVYSLVNGETYAEGGGLNEQFLDYRTKIVNATAAALSAPIGVTVSCDGGVVTLEWHDALPHTDYRVYRGPSASGAWTVVGDVDGVTITDEPTEDQRWWYKVVTVSGGAEQGYRVVSVYVSSSSPLVNEHIDRVLKDGASASTINAAWLQTVVDWLESEGLTHSLMWWTDPAFGVIKDGSNIISKVYCLGTTLLPRGGDYKPTTSATTYSATGLNSTAPALVNANSNSFGYFGNGRINNIQRKTQVTCVAVYQKSHTSKVAPIAIGEFVGMKLSHTAGTPGDASFALSDADETKTDTIAMSSATGAHIIAGTYDGTTVYAYADGVRGSGQTGLDMSLGPTYTALKGQIGVPSNVQTLVSGSSVSKYEIGSGSITFSNNEAQFSAGALIVFDVALTTLQMASLMTLLETRNGL